MTQFNRIFEKLLHKRLYSFISPHLYVKQFGFQPKNSTHHAILDLKEHILDKCSKKLISCILFLDLKKAFDTVSHEILLQKLEYYGVRGLALKLFTSYLTNRYQQTSVDGCISILELIEWGVPQGSVLGPLLFLIFINDLPLVSNLATWLFADDTVLVHSDSNLEFLKTKMNQEVDKIQTWLLANKLSVHYVGKSQYMLVNSRNNLQLPENCFELDMGPSTLYHMKFC